MSEQTKEREPATEVMSTKEFVAQIPEELHEKETGPVSDSQATINTLIASCEELSERAKKAEDALAKEQEHKEDLMAKLLRHHLDPNDVRTKPREEDLQEFARSVFGDRPFQKEYTVAGNNTVTMSALTDKEGQIVSKITKEATDELEKEQSPVAMVSMYKLKMLWHIRKVNKLSYEFPEKLDSYAQAKEVIDGRFGDKPDSFIGIMIRLVETHSTLMNLLAVHMFDENFYKGAGLH